MANAGFSINTLNNMVYNPPYLNNIPIRCNYVTPESLSNNETHTIPIMSFNIRSTKANFDNFFSEILTPSSHFKIIGLCETKLLDSTETLYVFHT